MASNKFDSRPRWVRHRRVRVKVYGELTRPRLAVFRSNSHIYAQIINDREGRTIVSASTLDPDLREVKHDKVKHDKKSSAATKVGASLAKRALAAGIDSVVFDRGGYKYHGRVKALAEAAREEGLKF